MKYISTRKYAGLEWECYKDKDGCYLAINHKFGESIHSESWDILWEKIINKSKNIRNKK